MKRNRKFSLERLEERQLMAGDLAVSAFANLDASILDRAIPATAIVPTVPQYSSNAGAAATLYLDFDGHFEAQWGSYSNVLTPVFSRDADTTSFSSSELATIKQVWQRVSEDFASFNINVTTVNPGNFDNGKALRVAIGGSWQDWYHEAGGVALRGSFTNVDPNVVYVFSEVDFGSAKNIADAASHEAGHAFGLRHQSLFDDMGRVVEKYRTGSPEKGPLMGNTYGSERTTWSYGTVSDGVGDGYVMQDDMAVIASATNGFGYRPDDFGSNTYDAYLMGPLSSYGPISNISGYIGKTSDADWFQFNVTTAGRMSLQANVAEVGANLDVRLSLFRLESHLHNGKVVFSKFPLGTADPSTSLNASLAFNVTPGTYIAVVDSHGEYGDVGYYMLKGSFSQPLTFDPGLVNGPNLNVKTSVAPKRATVIQPTFVATIGLNSSPQVLAATTSSRDTSPIFQSTSNLATTSVLLRAAAVDEALASRVRVKSHKLPAELLDVLAAG